jgi:hypothetical protein
MQEGQEDVSFETWRRDVCTVNDILTCYECFNMTVLYKGHKQIASLRALRPLDIA